MDNRPIRRLEYAGLLSDAEREALHTLVLRPLTVAARTDIDIGGPPNSVCLILSGIACRYKIWSDGARRIISLIVPGDICDGHLPLPFMLGHTVGALTPCTVADIPRHAMAELIETFPRIAHTLVVPVAGRCARTQRGLEVPLQLLIRTHISLCH